MKNVKKTWVVLALLGCMQVLHAQTVYLHSDNPQMKWKLKPQAEVGTDVKSLCGNGYNGKGNVVTHQCGRNEVRPIL